MLKTPHSYIRYFFLPNVNSEKKRNTYNFLMVDKKIKQNQYSEILILEIIFSCQDSDNVIIFYKLKLNKWDMVMIKVCISVDAQNIKERWKIHSCFFNNSYVRYVQHFTHSYLCKIYHQIMWHQSHSKSIRCYWHLLIQNKM